MAVADPAMCADSGRSTLMTLLDAELAYEVTTDRGLSSHLPMALVALDALGADADRLDTQFRRTVRGLVPLKDRTLRITCDNWLEHLGTGRHYAALRDHLDAEIARDGWERALRVHVRELADAAPTAAFHGMIRLAYGIDARHRGQIAGGLAYWADHRRPLVPTAPSTTPYVSVDLRETLERLRAMPTGRVAGTGLITDRLAAIARDDAFGKILSSTVADLDEVAESAVHLLAATDDFLVLHAVTGAHAARTVGRHLDLSTRATLTRSLLEGVAAAYVAVGAPDLPDEADIRALLRSPLPSWGDLIAGAVASQDDHVIKLTFTARAEHARTDDEIYRFVAARHAQLV